MVTMFSQQQQAQGADTLKPGHWLIQDWDAGLLVIPQAGQEPHPLKSYTVVLLNRQGEAVAQCSWAADDTETFAEPIRILRDGDILPEDEPSYQLVRFVPASQC
jgi:hypothetical protein